MVADIAQMVVVGIGGSTAAVTNCIRKHMEIRADE